MAEAEVGDDVWEEDPTVQRLEARAAARFGKAAGLFVASGTMGNQVAVLAHTQPGQEVLAEADSAHGRNLEVGGIARLGLCQAQPLQTDRGLPDPDAVRRAIRPANIHIPATGLLALENTHNLKGGTAFTPEEIAAAATVGPGAWGPRPPRRRPDLQRLRGPRAGGAREYGAVVDSVQFCLSKGLGAASRLARRGPGGLHRPRPADAQAPGRGHAPGRRPGRGRADGPRHHGRPTGRGPSERAASGRGPGRACPAYRIDLTARPDQHRHLRGGPPPAAPALVEGCGPARSRSTPSGRPRFGV